MHLDRHPGAVYLYLTPIRSGGVEESIDANDVYAPADPAVLDIGADGRVLGVEWLEPCLPQRVVPDVEHHPGADRAIVWLVATDTRSVTRAARVPADFGLPGELALHFGPAGDLQGIEAQPASRLLPPALLGAPRTSR